MECPFTTQLLDVEVYQTSREAQLINTAGFFLASSLHTVSVLAFGMSLWGITILLMNYALVISIYTANHKIVTVTDPESPV